MAADAEYDYKMQYAALLQRVAKDKRQQYSAQVVKQVIGKDNAAKYTSWVLQKADDWLFDPDVVAEVERLDSIRKTPEQVLQKVWDIIADPGTENRDRVLALRLYSEAINIVGRSGGKDELTQNATLDKLTQLFNAAKP